MTNKKLLILGIIAAVMVVAVIIQSTLQDTKITDSGSIRYLLQGLDTSRIASIEIAAADNKATLVKKNSDFTVKELSGYPAKISQVNDLITKCLDIKVGEVYTSNPLNFQDLGVSEDNARYIVKFSNAGGEIITGVVISEASEGRSYVRRIDSDNVYVAEQSVWLNAAPTNYVEQQISNVGKASIVDVKVSSSGEEYTIKQTGGKAQLQNIPEGKVAKQSECDRVLNAFASLRFDDVKSANELKELAFTDTYVVRLDNSTVYTAKIAEKDGKTYVSLKADFTDQTPVTLSRDGESDEELKKKEAKLLANEAAEKYTRTHSGWVYTLASHTAENLTKPLSDLLEDAPEPEIVAGSEPVEPEVEDEQPPMVVEQPEQSSE